MIIYLSIEYYYFTFNNLISFYDFAQIPELIDIMGLKVIIPFVIIFIIPIIIFIININYKSYKIYLFIFIIVLSTFLSIKNALPINNFIEKDLGIYSKIAQRNLVTDHGMIFIVIKDAIKRISMSKIKNKSFEVEPILNLDKDIINHIKKRNIYLLILESYLDVTKFKNIKFNISPEYKNYTKLFEVNKTNSITSIFGGNSAQSEFEILCGVPALSLFSKIDFNLFTGKPSMCLPQFLKKLDYFNIATNSYKPYYFNTLNAYKSIGFDLNIFRKDFMKLQKIFLEPNDLVDNRMFDGELFRQHLKLIKKLKKEHKFMFNYLLGIYGHHPFYRNTKKRPDVIFEDSNNEQIHRISNQYYYRTKAIYEYVTELRKIDPNSIIIIVSDHLPPLDKGKGEYERLGYLKDINDKRKLYFNTMLVFDGDKVIKYNLVHHFNVPVIIMNLLTDGYYCKINKCHLDGKPYKKEDYLNKYLTIVTEKTLPE
jgi:hypothetical protein